MGLYDAKGAAGGLNSVLSTAKKHALTDFPSGEIARAKLRLVNDGTVLNVQFNPNTLEISSNAPSESQTTVSGQEQTTVTYSMPHITMTVELLFDALNNEGLVSLPGGLLNPLLPQASKVFPKSTSSVVAQVEFFYNMLASFNKRQVEFAWNQFHFEGYAEDVHLSITLFDEAGDPTRMKARLTIRNKVEKTVERSGLSSGGLLPSKPDLNNLLRR